MRHSPKQYGFIGILLLLGLVGTVALYAQAEFAIGSIVKKFELPQRDGDGNLLLTIHGQEATVISRNRIKVDGLKIDIVRNGKVETVLTSPSSDFWRQEGRLTSDAGVVVEHPHFRLEAKKMNWELEPSRGTFETGVRMHIKSPLGKESS